MRKKDNYKIYKFIIKNPVLATIGTSSIAALMSMLLVLMSYTFISSYCNMWNIPKEIVQAEKGYIYYRMLASVIIIASMVVFVFFIWQKAQECSSLCRQVDYFRYHGNKVKYNKASILYPLIQNEINKNFETIKDIRLMRIVKNIVYVTVISIFMYPSFLTFVVVVSGVQEANFKIIVSIVIVTVSLFIINFDALFIEEKYKGYLEAYRLIEEQNNFINTKGKKEKTSFKGILEDNNIKKCLTYVFMAYLFVYILAMQVTKTNIDGFWVYQDSNNTRYVVVYQTDDLLVMDLAIFDENKVNIFIDEQYYLSRRKTKLSYKKVDSYEMCSGESFLSSAVQ